MEDGIAQQLAMILENLYPTDLPQVFLGVWMAEATSCS